jgi:hypothetical protein
MLAAQSGTLKKKSQAFASQLVSFNSMSQQLPTTNTPQAATRELCVIKMHLLPSDFVTFPTYRNELGKEFRKMLYFLKMHISVSSIEWSVTCQGRNIPVTAEYKDVNSAAQIPT